MDLNLDKDTILLGEEDFAAMWGGAMLSEDQSPWDCNTQATTLVQMSLTSSTEWTLDN
jgi:hypothetical protein